MSAVDGASLEEVLSGLVPGQEAALFHLLTCDACRGWASAKLLEKAGGRLLLPPEELSQEGDAGGADGLVSEMLGAEADADLERIARQASPEDALENVLQASQTGQAFDPAGSERIAALAVRFIDFISLKSTARAAALTRAAVLIANARRLAGRLGDAEAALGNALAFTAPPEERARFDRAMALVWWE